MTQPITAAGRHRAPEPPPVIVADTNPNNPVNAYPPNVFPTGAAITVAYGSAENMFCTLGNLYRIVGYLTGEVPSIEGQAEDPGHPGDPTADPPIPERQPRVHIPSLADEIARCRLHVAAQLPAPLQQLTLPDFDAGEADRTEWLTAIYVAAGPTVILEKLPADG